MTDVSLYLPNRMHNRVTRGNHPFYSRLISVFNEAGIKVAVKDPVSILDNLDEYAIHHDIVIEGANSLTAWSTPLERFWQMSKGPNLIAKEVFDKKAIHKGGAEDFYYKVQESEFETSENDYPIDNYILAVLQHKPRQKHEGQWCSGVKMIERTLKFDTERHIVIWTPPKVKLQEKDEIALAPLRENDRVTFSTADENRILASCAYVVTQNHEMGFLANFFKKPTIYFAPNSFGHAAENIFAEDRPKRSFNRVETARVEYEKYVYWYLSEHSLDTRGKKNHARILETCRELGWGI